jgi:hypothetical protein
MDSLYGVAMFLSPTTLSSSQQPLSTPYFRRTEYYPHSYSLHVQAQQYLCIFNLDEVVIVVAIEATAAFELLHYMNYLKNCEVFGPILVGTAVPCWVN